MFEQSGTHTASIDRTDFDKLLSEKIMNQNKCINCSEYKRCKETWISWSFFLIGVIATIAVRAVTILIHVDTFYGQIAWYVGITGFFIFFLYKFKVEHARSRLIRATGIMEKISQNGPIETKDRELISSILCALSSNKDRINYFLIFTSSAVALIIAVYFDFFK